MAKLESLRPLQQRHVIDLVREAGLDVSDWGNFKSGPAKAAVNPKYCYEWAFKDQQAVVLNLWYQGLQEKHGVIWSNQSIRTRAPSTEKSASEVVWKRRAEKFDAAVRYALENGLPLRIVICDGEMRDAAVPNAKASKVTKRKLDTVSWAVTQYDFRTGACTLTRGVQPIAGETTEDQELSFFEGKAKERFVIHRSRERKLRAAKIAEALSKNGGRLTCQVSNCGFDFFDRYGAIGTGYAQVHHLRPLKDMSRHGSATSLKDLAVVCANCHAMIHVGGQCRSLDTLIPAK